MMPDQVEQKCTLPRDSIVANIATNRARGIPPYPLHDQQGALAVAGNGPSLRSLYPNRADGKPIVALNGAWRQLASKGVTPDYVIAYDPDPNNVAWFQDAPKGPTYILGSRMDPRCFDLLNDHKVFLWHVYDSPEHEAGASPLIGGGGTVGSSSLNVLASMGYTHFDLYGYDSCYALDGADHAWPQPWSAAQPSVFQVGDRKFLSAPWMISQIEQLAKQIAENRHDYTVKVMNDKGLLAAVLKEKELEVVYPLDKAPGSFDFCHSMFNVGAFMHQNGFATAKVYLRPGPEDGFRNKDLVDIGLVRKQGMIDKVVPELIRMAGHTQVNEVSENGVEFFWSPMSVLEYYRRNHYLSRMIPNLTAREWAHEHYSDGPVVITLRECEHWPQRNSNKDEWFKFARWVAGPDRRVVFVRDTYALDTPFPDDLETCREASVDLQKRLALYRRASMNLCVTNGPFMMCIFSQDIPYLMFQTAAEGYPCYDPRWHQQFIGVDPYGQYPWANLSKQQQVYDNDDFVTICRKYDEMMTGGPKLMKYTPINQGTRPKEEPVNHG